MRGASKDAGAFKGRAALPAIINGKAGTIWPMVTQVRAAFLFTIEFGKIAGIDPIMQPGPLAEIAVKID